MSKRAVSSVGELEESECKKAKPSETKSPYAAYMDALDAEKKRVKAEGSICVRGYNEGNEGDTEDEEEEGEADLSKLSAEQVGRIRIIIGTKRRIAERTAADKLVLGDQFDDGVLMFNTSFSYEIPGVIKKAVAAIQRAASPDHKLDKLIAITMSLQTYDCWMYDHEAGWGSFGGAKALKSLARQWKTLLAKDNETLGIDDRFMRPAIEYLAASFKEAIEELDDAEEEGLTFNYA